jgi:hypothetical protein
MRTAVESPYAAGQARAHIERALTAAGMDVHTLQASEIEGGDRSLTVTKVDSAT